MNVLIVAGRNFEKNYPGPQSLFLLEATWTGNLIETEHGTELASSNNECDRCRRIAQAAKW
jgi:hypothetical protein